MPRNKHKRTKRNEFHNAGNTPIQKLAAYRRLLQKEDTPLAYEPAVRFLREEFKQRNTLVHIPKNANDREHIQRLRTEIDASSAIVLAKLKSFYLTTAGFTKGSSDDCDRDDTFLETPYENIAIAYQQVLAIADAYFIDKRRLTLSFGEVKNAVNVMGYRQGFPKEQYSWRSVSLIEFRHEAHRVLSLAYTASTRSVPRRTLSLVLSFFRRLRKQ